MCLGKLSETSAYSFLHVRLVLLVAEEHVSFDCQGKVTVMILKCCKWLSGCCYAVARALLSLIDIFIDD